MRIRSRKIVDDVVRRRPIVVVCVVVVVAFLFVARAVEGARPIAEDGRPNEAVRYKTNDELRTAFDGIARRCRSTSTQKRTGKVISTRPFGQWVEIFCAASEEREYLENKNNNKQKNKKNNHNKGEENERTAMKHTRRKWTKRTRRTHRYDALRLVLSATCTATNRLGEKLRCVWPSGRAATDDDSFFGNNIDLKGLKVKTNATLYFIPTLNPDGFVKRRRQALRTGVDRNRDFSDLSSLRNRNRRRCRVM